MRISFRQGIVSHQTGFLNINPSGNVDLLASNRPVVVTIADRNVNYLFSEDFTVNNAWMGPFNPSATYWLYWDFNTLTFQRTFGSTTLEPVIQSVEPGAGDVAIVGATPGSGGTGTFAVEGEYVLAPGRQFAVIGSIRNNGTYTVASAVYSGSPGTTTITVNETVPSGISDGFATLDFDSNGIPLKVTGRHWYNTATNIHYVLNGLYWSKVLRVFACKVVNGITFSPMSITPGSFIGTQIGVTGTVFAGRVLFDESSNPIRRDNKTFFTTEDQMFANASRVDAVRLESNVIRAQFPYEAAVAAFTPVAWRAEGKVQTAQYDDIGSTVVGILTEDVLLNETGAVIVQGAVVNPDWNWTAGPDAVAVGSPLWIENGALVPYDPHTRDVLTYPVGRVPVARVLDRDTVIFEQGLGGKGERGPIGPAGAADPATEASYGVVLLSLAAEDPNLAIVAGDNDPRLFDARVPLAHTHQASEINFTPTGEITSSTVDAALIELASKKLSKTGGTMTGSLLLHADPTTNLQAATKQYVDSITFDSNADAIVFSPYTSTGEWGTPIDSSILTISSTDVQGAIEELFELKALKTPFYQLETNLPAANDVPGMLAVVNAYATTVFSDGVQWNKLALENHTHVLPYDIAFFASGTAADTTDKLIGMYVATREITIQANTNNLQGYATTPSSCTAITFSVQKNDVEVGQVIFDVGANTPTSNSVTSSTFVLSPGDRMKIVSPSLDTDPDLADVSITIIGCAPMGTCPT